MAFEYGPLREYEVTWTNGHVETIKAHQVLLPQTFLWSDYMRNGGAERRQRYTFHGQVDGRWILILDAPAEDIRMVRDKASEQALEEGL